MRPLSFLVDDAALFNVLTPRQRHTLAVALMIVSAFTISGLMVAVKLASAELSLFQLMFFRSAAGALLCVPFMVGAGLTLFPRGVWRLYAWRIALTTMAVGGWLYSIAHLPLATASALMFSKAFFALALAALFLRERITAGKVTATVAGFTGIVLVLGPVAAGGTLIAGLAGVAAALFGAGLTVVIKRLSATEPTVRMMFYPLSATAILLAIPAALTWQPVSLDAAGLVALMIACGMVSQWCFLNAYRLGEVSALAPAEYARLLVAAALGYLVFSEVPTWVGVGGMVLIAVSALSAFRLGGRADAEP